MGSERCRTDGRRKYTVPSRDLANADEAIRDEIAAAILAVARRGDFVLGSETAAFEQAFARFLDVKHAVGVGNCLDALRLSLAAMDVGPGDEVIVPANTFIATALAVSGVGARPVLVDCHPRTYNIDTEQIEAAITPSTRAIIPVHLTGQAAEMDPILELAERRGLPVIEDVAHSPGATYRGRSCGTLGRSGCFSFYPSKNFGAFGDGGLIATGDDDLAQRLRLLRNYGQEVKYEHPEKGVNSRLDTIQAAVLNVKLPHLPAWNKARQARAEEYRRQLDGVGDIAFQEQSPHSTHVYHLFVIETDQRDDLLGHLQEDGVEALIHYPKPIHLQKAYTELGYREGDFPVTESLARRTLSLPISPELTPEQVRHVTGSIRAYFGRT